MVVTEKEVEAVLTSLQNHSYNDCGESYATPVQLLDALKDFMKAEGVVCDMTEEELLVLSEIVMLEWGSWYE